MRVLLIEDDCAMARSITDALKLECFNVHTAPPGEAGFNLNKHSDYDVILLDLNLLDISGFDVLQRLRSLGSSTPVLILSGHACVDNKVKALNSGADDYLTKPFHRDELIARIHAMVRRSKGHADSTVQVGDLIVDLITKTAQVNGKRLHLSGKEYQLLELLSLHKGKSISTEICLSYLYSDADEPDSNSLNVFIYKLRKKLAKASGGKNYIETMWGHGYALSA